MSVLSVSEHAEIAVGDSFSADPKDPRIGQRHASLIERLNRRHLDRGAPAPFELGFRSVRARQYCGVVALGGESIEILPKIDDRRQPDDKAQSRICLLSMLAVARKLPLHPIEVANLARTDAPLLEIFIRLFATSALAVIRNGLIHRYERFEHELRSVRGKMMLARQATRNAARPDRIWCAYDDFNPDNELNRAIKAAAARALRVSTMSATQGLLREVLYSVEEISDAVPQVERFRAIPRDRLSRGYLELLDMAGIILFGPEPDVVSGGESHVALLFDMNKLFEEFIGRQLIAAAQEPDLSISLQGPKRWLGADSKGDKYFQLKPDVVVSRNENPLAVLDTKWKLLGAEDPISDIAPADVYQMLAYMTRYEVSTGVLLYPWRGNGDQNPVLASILMADKKLLVAGVDLHVIPGVPPQLSTVLSSFQ